MTEPLKAGERLVRPAKAPRSPKPPSRRPAPKRRPFRLLGRLFGALLALVVVAGVGGGLVVYGAYVKFSADLPDIDTLRDYQPEVMSRVYAGNSQLLGEFATERRIFVPSNAIPDIVKHAFISAEDKSFFTNPGIDPLAILRAAFTDLMQYGQGRRPIGASTITQQVAKNMLLDNEVSLARKAREAILAMRIEQSLSKEQILDLYLNEIYLGLQSYGVAAAAQAYFNKPLDQITLPEAAFLAALPKAPNNYNPFRFPDAARARRDLVLDRMEEDGVITAAQDAAAKATPIDTSPFSRPATVPGADYFTEEVRRTLVAQFGAEQTTQGGLYVHTSLDPALQQDADRALHNGLLAYDRARGGWRGPVSHLPPDAILPAAWPAALAQLPRPPGMLTDWQLAVVLSSTDSQATLGLLDGDGATPRTLPLQLSDLRWARKPQGEHLGPAPRRMAEVVQPGDVVMVEPVPASPAAGKTPARPERLQLRQIPQVQGALVCLDPQTGRVLAMSGGWSFEMSQFNRATQAMRQPGSSFKPMVYLTAMEHDISPSQRFLDMPFVVDLGAAGKWRPHNDEDNFSGPVPLRVALEKSLNLVTVRLANRLGMAAVAKTAIAFHVVDSMPLVLPAALGAVDTTVLRQAAAYAALDNGGREVVPTLIDSVQDRYGHVLWRAPALQCQGCDDSSHPPVLLDTRRQIADPASVFQVVTMMEGVMQRGTGQPVGAGLDRPLAGKTGTTSEFTDAWFVGFSPDLVTAVWVGFDNPAQTLGNNAYGASTAGPIWHNFMAAALQGRPKLNFVPPPGVTMAQWDSGSGMVTDAFKPGEVPGASGPVGDPIEIDTASSDVSATPASAPPSPHAAGVDSSLGGLY
jgi:penicillin-binding protein 1A